MRTLDAAADIYPRLRDAWEAITWAVVRDPEVGKAESESGRVRSFTFVGARSIGMPTITLIYEVTDELVIAHDVNIREAEYGQAGLA